MQMPKDLEASVYLDLHLPPDILPPDSLSYAGFKVHTLCIPGPHLLQGCLGSLAVTGAES